MDNKNDYEIKDINELPDWTFRLLAFIKDAWNNIKGNIVNCVCIVFIVFSAFLITSLVTFAVLNINANIKHVSDSMECQIYLKDDISELDKNKLYNDLNKNENVKSLLYKSKEEAFLDMKNNMSEFPEIYEGYDENNNPLPASYIVSLNNYDEIDNFINNFKDYNGVEDISNQKNFVENLKRINIMILLLGMILTGFLFLLGSGMIKNAITLTINSRKMEIKIMQLVGATNNFIRIPYIIEGIIWGLLGSLLNIIIMNIGYSIIYYNLESSIFIGNLILIDPLKILPMYSLLCIVAGCIICSFSSTITLNKYLKLNGKVY